MRQLIFHASCTSRRTAFTPHPMPLYPPTYSHSALIAPPPYPPSHHLQPLCTTCTSTLPFPLPPAPIAHQPCCAPTCSHSALIASPPCLAPSTQQPLPLNPLPQPLPLHPFPHPPAAITPPCLTSSTLPPCTHCPCTLPTPHTLTCSHSVPIAPPPPRPTTCSHSAPIAPPPPSTLLSTPHTLTCSHCAPLAPAPFSPSPQPSHLHPLPLHPALHPHTPAVTLHPLPLQPAFPPPSTLPPAPLAPAPCLPASTLPLCTCCPCSPPAPHTPTHLQPLCTHCAVNDAVVAAERDVDHRHLLKLTAGLGQDDLGEGRGGISIVRGSVGGTSGTGLLREWRAEARVRGRCETMYCVSKYPLHEQQVCALSMYLVSLFPLCQPPLYPFPPPCWLLGSSSNVPLPFPSTCLPPCTPPPLRQQSSPPLSDAPTARIAA